MRLTRTNMNQVKLQKSNTGKKFTLFVLFIIALFCLFTVGWYWAAGKVAETTDNAKSELARNGSVLKCNDQEVNGYPFRLGVFCSSIIFSDPANAISIKAEAFRSAAQLYRPGHVIAELDSPVDLQVPNLAPLTLDWENLATSTNISTNGLNRISVKSSDLEISANDFGIKDLLGTIKALEIHARPSPEDVTNASLDLAANIADWKVSDGGTKSIEPINFNLDVKIDGLLATIQRQQNLENWLRQFGANGEIRNLNIATQTGGEFSVKGPLSVSKNGLVSGELSFAIRDPETLIIYASKVFPPAAAMLVEAQPYIESLAKVTDGTVELKNIKLTIIDGRVQFGFLKIADIPRLF